MVLDEDLSEKVSFKLKHLLRCKFHYVVCFSNIVLLCLIITISSVFFHKELFLAFSIFILMNSSPESHFKCSGIMADKLLSLTFNISFIRTVAF